MRRAWALLVAAHVLGCGGASGASPAAAPAAPPPVVVLPTPPHGEAAPPPAPGAPVIVARVTTGGFREVGHADSVEIVDASATDESIEGVALFPVHLAPHIHPGVELEAAFAANPYAVRSARVLAVTPAADGRVSATFRARRLNPLKLDAIRHGASVRVYLRMSDRPGVRLLRADAIHFEGGKAYVFRIVEGKPARVERRAVVPGAIPEPPTPAASQEIVAGLEIGDAVVLDGPLDLRDRQEVEVVAPPHRTGIPRDECNPVRFGARADGSVLDTRRRIVWQKGLSPAPVTFDEGDAACRAAGMRLPTRTEIETLSEDELHTHTCAMDPGGDYFWTSSPGEYVGTFWAMSPWGSAPSSAGRGQRESVRCVRDLAPGER